MNASNPPTVLVLLVNDPVIKRAWRLVGIYLSDRPIQAIMKSQREWGKVEETFEPVKPFESGLECSWDESEAIIADDRIPSMLYTVTANDGQFVRQFRAIALPLLGGREMPYLDAWLGARSLPEWARS